MAEAISTSDLRRAPGVRFDPTDADQVLHYLPPCLCCRAEPTAAGFILDADSYATPPSHLIAVHRRSDDALFFVFSAKNCSHGARAWRVQWAAKGAVVAKDGEAVAWCTKTFSYCPDDWGDSGWWVMRRYE